MATLNKYRIYFKWLGEKKRIDIEAENKYDAENILMDKLEIIHTKLIDGNEPKQNNSPDLGFFKDIFNMK